MRKVQIERSKHDQHSFHLDRVAHHRNGLLHGDQRTDCVSTAQTSIESIVRWIQNVTWQCVGFNDKSQKFSYLSSRNASRVHDFFGWRNKRISEVCTFGATVREFVKNVPRVDNGFPRFATNPRVAPFVERGSADQYGVLPTMRIPFLFHDVV